MALSCGCNCLSVKPTNWNLMCPTVPSPYTALCTMRPKRHQAIDCHQVPVCWDNFSITHPRSTGRPEFPADRPNRTCPLSPNNNVVDNADDNNK
ncbi:hypothetical protein T11_16664 [Trichinella zimbabwensis]|uniref:Uncharacterized protein n=2 Tax=Trichinella TaxID=6333 RepID=A0A0V1MMZ5_9BILA|nr:hypothetical protein T11_16664 [Trichinella zimbabwensis]KRZ73188.1 hypothetical protein T10_3789 [Trichinella papuae]